MARKPTKNDGFLLCLVLNMLLNLEWTVPAWILLVLHFALELSIIWFWAALGIWFAVMLIIAVLFTWVGSFRATADTKENKNPYSAKEFPRGKE